MYINRVLALFPVLVLFSFFTSCTAEDRAVLYPDEKPGVYLLSSPQGIVDLAARWAFYPGEFVPADTDPSRAGRYEFFPAAWSNYHIPHDANHFGSYAIHIRNLDPSIQYAFLFPGYSSAVRYFVNGKELYSCGVVGKTAEEERDSWDNLVVPMSGPGVSEVTIVLHLSNFSDIFPASPTAVSFGPISGLSAKWSSTRVFMILPFGAILAMGVYFIALYMFHRQNMASFWLGLLCIIFAVRIICYDHFIIQDILPGFSTNLMFRLGYLTFSLALASFAGFIRYQYPQYARVWLVRGIAAVSLLYSLFVLVTSRSFFTSILFPFQLVAIISAMILLLIVARSAIDGRPGARLFLVGFFFFFFSVIRDILISNRVIEGVFLSHYGILGIIGAMAIIIVADFSRAFTALEAATRETALINESLKRFVPNEFLRYLGRQSINEVCLGDSTSRSMCVMFVHLGMHFPLHVASARVTMLEFFNSTIQRLNPVIEKHGGFIDKYLTEGLLILFPDDPCTAATCALDLYDEVRQINGEDQPEKYPEIVFAAGVHRGPLMLGTIGENERMDSTVISDVVNIASRIQKHALEHGHFVLLSEDVQAGLKTPAEKCVTVTPLGEIKLRGRTQTMKLFEVQR